MKTFTSDGDVEDVPDGAPVNDLSRSPVYDTIPNGALYVLIALASKVGVPRVGLVKPSALVTQDDVQSMLIDAVNVSRQGLVDEFRARDESLAEAVAMLQVQANSIDSLHGTEADHTAALEVLVQRVTAAWNTLNAQDIDLSALRTQLLAADASLVQVDERLDGLVHDVATRTAQLESVTAALGTANTALTTQQDTMRLFDTVLGERTTQLETLTTDLNSTVLTLQTHSAALQAISAEFNARDTTTQGILEDFQRLITQLQMQGRELVAVNGTVQVALQQLRDQDTALGNVDAELRAKDVTLDAVDAELRRADADIRALVAALQTLTQALRDKDAQLDAVDAALRAKDIQIDAITAALTAKDVQLDAVDASLRAKDTAIEAITTALAAKDVQLETVDASLQAKDTQLAALIADLQTLVAGLQARQYPVELAEQTYTQAATVALLAAPTTYTKTGITGLKAGDRVLIFPKTSYPSGFLFGGASAPADGTLVVHMDRPAITIGAAITWTVRVMVFRP